MNKEPIISTLRQLRAITPDEEFADRTKNIIARTPQSVPISLARPRGFFEALKPLGAGALAVLVIIAAGALYLGTEDRAHGFSGLNNEEILEEMAASGDINIYLHEISYHDEASRMINVALQELTRQNP